MVKGTIIKNPGDGGISEVKSIKGILMYVADQGMLVEDVVFYLKFSDNTLSCDVDT